MGSAREIKDNMRLENVERMLDEIQKQLISQDEKFTKKLDRLSQNFERLSFIVIGDDKIKDNSLYVKVKNHEDRLGKVEEWQSSIKVSWLVIGGISGLASPIIYFIITTILNRWIK